MRVSAGRSPLPPSRPQRCAETLRSCARAGGASAARGAAWSSAKCLAVLVAACLAAAAAASSPTDDSSGSAERDGLELLLHEPLSLAAFTLDELDRLWTVWEPDERQRAERATPDERRRLAFARYGLIERPGDPTLPLGYTADTAGNLYPNCLACHGGKVAGTVIPGLPNTHQDVQTLLEDLAALRASERGGDPDSARANATFGFPMTFYKGLTNATQYSILLGAMRDENLELVFPPRLSQEYVHNDIDAPPWWHFSKKARIYWDGMAPKTTRTLMQFAMAPGLPGERIRGWEDEFEVIRRYIEQLEPPPYPFAIDRQLAARGRVAFEATCSSCHGTYGAEPSYPGKTVPLDIVGTDPLRLGAIAPSSKAKYNRSWFSEYGKHPVRIAVTGYVAPPLDGIWASAPYFHNGSVPTLWHVLHPDQRPRVWRRTTDGYDRGRVGLEIEELERVPDGLSPRLRRTFYDVATPSHSATGHRFPDELDEAQRRAVLEYLKTL